jgi:hypothetical protein
MIYLESRNWIDHLRGVMSNPKQFQDLFDDDVFITPARKRPRTDKVWLTTHWNSIL